MTCARVRVNSPSSQSRVLETSRRDEQRVANNRAALVCARRTGDESGGGLLQRLRAADEARASLQRDPAGPHAARLGLQNHPRRRESAAPTSRGRRAVSLKRDATRESPLFLRRVRASLLGRAPVAGRKREREREKRLPLPVCVCACPLLSCWVCERVFPSRRPCRFPSRTSLSRTSTRRRSRPSRSRSRTRRRRATSSRRRSRRRSPLSKSGVGSRTQHAARAYIFPRRLTRLPRSFHAAKLSTGPRLSLSPEREKRARAFQRLVPGVRSIIIKAEGEAEAAELIGAAIQNNPGFIKLRKIETAKEIATTISSSQNKVSLSVSTDYGSKVGFQGGVGDERVGDSCRAEGRSNGF